MRPVLAMSMDKASLSYYRVRPVQCQVSDFEVSVTYQIAMSMSAVRP